MSENLSEEAGRRKEFIFPVADPVAIQVRIGIGSINIETRGDCPEVTVVAVAEREDSPALENLNVAMRGRTLVVTSPRPHGGWFDVAARLGGQTDPLEIRLIVPTDSDLQLGAYSAQIHASGQLRRVDLATGTLRADLDRVNHELRIRYGSGTVKVAEVGGRAVIKAAKCDLQFGVVEASVDTAFASGNLDIDRVAGPVRARYSTGRATLNQIGADIDISAGATDIDMGLATGQVAKIDIVTGGGKFVSDLPVEHNSQPETDALSVRVRTGTGLVRLYRATEHGQSMHTD